MSLFWNLCWGFSQVAVVSILVALTGTIWKSADDPRMTEWKACDRPLGIWAIMWVCRVVLASGLAYWDFVRQRAGRALSATANAGLQASGMAPMTSPGPPLSTDSPPTLVPPASTPSQVPVNDPESSAVPNDPTATLPYTRLYRRLTLLSSLLTLSWFLTAHILEYTSLNTCRHTSPHLWWLIFGILCIMYVMVLEVLLLGFIILVLAPIVFVFWNIFLFCIGRHPAQNAHVIKPDIGKLSKSLVDRIPLVMYIPPPPNTPTIESDAVADSEKPPSLTPAHEYPPSPPTLAPTAPITPATPPAPKKLNLSKRFRFFKRKKQGTDIRDAQSSSSSTQAPDDSEKEETWEGHFEKSDYPFVVLEGNRAACAICLMDFEEPRRRRGAIAPSGTPVHLSLPTLGEASSSSSPVSLQQSDAELKLTDAGEGAQPLRLLACGHVFHQTCLDPWLTDVSGRCPVCQRPVDIAQLRQRGKRNR